MCKLKQKFFFRFELKYPENQENDLSLHLQKIAFVIFCYFYLSEANSFKNEIALNIEQKYKIINHYLNQNSKMNYYLVDECFKLHS